MQVPYKVECNNLYGRYLAAARDIKQGEIIMKEKPEILGSQISAFPICFKCSGRIYTPTPVPCSECGIAPTCGLCHGSMHENECSSLAASGVTFKFLCENPQVAMPLRCLLLKFANEKTWNEFIRLESHVEQRRDTYIYNLHRNQVINPLKEASSIVKGLLNPDECMQSVCGILDVNTFEVRPNKHFQGPEDCLRGLYLKPALMAHGCLSNTHLSVDEEFVMTIRAALPIAQDEMIVFNYTNSLLGNVERQKHLEHGKYFRCMCRRCTDPNELGTGMSSIVCPKCKQASVVLTPNDIKIGKWKCLQCECEFSRCMIRTTLACARDKVQQTLENGDLHQCKQLVNALRRSFHGQHALIIEMNQKIISLLSAEPDAESAIEKIGLCEELLGILQVIEPGISRHQGIVQYEMHNAQLHLGKLRYNASQITCEAYLEQLRTAGEVLKGAIGHLIYEPKTTPEGRLAQKALNDLQVLRATIKDIEALAHRKRQTSKKHSTKT